jgi:hypothetical protein
MLLRLTGRPARGENMKTLVGGGTPGGGSGAAALMEALESRQLMSTNLTWVGVNLASGANSVMYADAVLADDLTLTGTQLFATPSGVQTGQPIDAVSMTFGAGGTMSITRGNGFAPFLTQDGTDFRRTPLSYVLGTHEATYDADGPAGQAIGQSVRLLVERRPEFTAYWTADRISVRLTRLTADGVEYRQIGLQVRADDVVVLENPSQSLEDGVSKPILSRSDDGVITFGSGEKLIFARTPAQTNREQVAVYFDGDASDGTVGYGLGSMKSSMAQGVLPHAQQQQVVFRGWIATPNATARALLGVTDPAAPGTNVVVTLSWGTSAFALYRPEGFGVAGQSPVWQGTWTTSRYSDLYSLVSSPSNVNEQLQLLTNKLCLVGADGQELVFLRSAGFTLAGGIYRTTASEERFNFGAQLSTAVFAAPAASVGLLVQSGDIDAQGHPILYTVSQYDPNQWFKVDLVTLTGGKPLVQGVVSRAVGLGPREDWAFVGIASDGHVVGYEFTFLQSNYQQVRFVDYTQVVPDFFGGAMFTSQSTVFLDAGQGIAQVAGITTQGKFIVGRIEAHRAASGATAFTDVTASLAQVGQTVPAWVGPISGYQTPWRGVAVAGFNAAGEMEVVWTAPVISGWRSNNLSVISGAPAMGGPIATQVTSWQGINMTARTTSGDLAVVWWAPELVGDWRYSNITVQTGAPKAAATDFRGRLSTLVAWEFGRTLNVASIGVDGITRVFWWEQDQAAWKITVVNPPFDAQDGPMALVPDVRDLARSDRHQFYAVNGDSDLLRVYWQSEPKDEWIISNVGEGAI